jgi:hypothetical protein
VSKDSAVRNLLLDLNVISYDDESGFYVMEARYFSLFTEIALRGKHVSPKQAAVRQQERDELGLAGEKVVLDYERRRVGMAYAGLVRHIAAEDISAGYDVESVTCGGRGSIYPRLIEVKAVCASNYRFYWTRNEVEAARQFGAWYYLYLVPVLSNSRFDLSGMQMVPNPYKSVLHDCLAWNVEVSTYQCDLVSMDARGFEAGGLT